MSPVGSLAGAYRVPLVALQQPVDLATVIMNPIFQWGSLAAHDKKNVPVHWRLQISSVSDFSTLVAEYMSALDASQFDYESSPGVWTPLPSTGLPIAQLGKNVRFRSSLSPLGTYFWRVRSEQLV